MFIEITKVKLILTNGCDKIYLSTTLPNGCYPYTGNTTLCMDVAYNYGFKYIKENFKNIVLEVINNRTNQ